jgi:hypothetical protein
MTLSKPDDQATFARADHRTQPAGLRARGARAPPCLTTAHPRSRYTTMPKKTTPRTGRRAGPQDRTHAHKQISVTDLAARPAASETSPGLRGSHSLTPVQSDVSDSTARMISYIARQIATDIVRDGRLPTSRKRT